MDRRTFNKVAALAGVGLLTEPLDLLSLRAAAAEGSVEFDPQRRFHCRGGIAHDGHDHLLFVNQQVSTPEDISRSLVPEFYLKLKAGNVLQGAFRVGSVTRQRG